MSNSIKGSLCCCLHPENVSHVWKGGGVCFAMMKSQQVLELSHIQIFTTDA